MAATAGADYQAKKQVITKRKVLAHEAMQHKKVERLAEMRRARDVAMEHQLRATAAHDERLLQLGALRKLVSETEQQNKNVAVWTKPDTSSDPAMADEEPLTRLARSLGEADFVAHTLEMRCLGPPLRPPLVTPMESTAEARQAAEETHSRKRARMEE
eukprot:7399396-Pyramimonas_sp.AAC.1